MRSIIINEDYVSTILESFLLEINEVASDKILDLFSLNGTEGFSTLLHTLLYSVNGIKHKPYGKDEIDLNEVERFLVWYDPSPVGNFFKLHIIEYLKLGDDQETYELAEIFLREILQEVFKPILNNIGKEYIITHYKGKLIKIQPIVEN